MTTAPHLADLELIRLPSFEGMFEEPARSSVERVLPQFVTGQRWYRSKAKTIRSASIKDAVRLGMAGSFATLIRIDYTDDEHETYLLPLLAGQAPETGVDKLDAVARLQNPAGDEVVLYNALVNAQFRASLLEAIRDGRVFRGAGELISQATEALNRREAAGAPPESKVSRAEQSNSSIIFGDRYILKLFRKLESGINPDIEVGLFLTRQRFKHTPAVLGEIRYKTAAGDESYAGILQRFVANEGDAWKHALESLAGYFERALAQEEAPAAETVDVFELIDAELPALAQQTIGDYLQSAQLLGVRTAQMHEALASSSEEPDFAPEPFSADYADVLYGEMMHEADRAFGLLREKGTTLPAEAAQTARMLLEKEEWVRERFGTLRTSAISAKRIRHHGDYHLGQVLYTGSDFVIIDFEGEPARPLAARRLKTLALRDVAGMLRSFSYAAYAALFGQVAGVPTDPAKREAVDAWATFWVTWVSAAYLKGYFENAQASSFAGSNRQEQKLLLDSFILQKALYETTYELNNRPSWVEIPLRGILSLVK